MLSAYGYLLSWLLMATGNYAYQGQIILSTANTLDKWIAQQQVISYHAMLKNINPPGTRQGFFAASLSTYHPDYFYTWTRDAALVARVLTHLPETNDSLLKDYMDFQQATQTTSTVCQCLGEPKFYPNGSGYQGTWGRPQNDGPAERAITWMLIAKRLNASDDAYLPLINDLRYVTEVWQQPCFDLWEEVEGVHFHTLMVMRRALLDAVDFLQDTSYPTDQYRSTAKAIEARLETFWSEEHKRVIVTQDRQRGVSKPSQLDVAVLLAANLVAYRQDGFFSPGSDKILATAVALEDAFKTLYPINQDDLGTSIGRYPEDIYDGYGLSQGNPWFLATAAYTELYYLATEEWKQHGLVINEINRGFFERIVTVCPDASYLAPDSLALDQLVTQVKQKADGFLRTIEYHQAHNGSMSEQFDRVTGFMAGARDLTWSHAAFISAVQAKLGTPIQ
ncbi:Six-hairpin glycosidase-like protein [Choanephora cucurbitarum]|nr:Six-hairpin glycosidase-like protein [Choanephora cucurbitarum]